MIKTEELVAPASPATERIRVLIADDQADVREALRLLLKAEGYYTETASNPEAVIEALQTNEFDLVLMDLNYQRDTTSGQEGIELLNRIQAIDSRLVVVVMTAWGSVELAVEAMRRGARDFVQSPGTTRACSALSARRWICIAPCAARSVWKRKTIFCERKTVPSLLLNPRPCSHCSRLSAASAPVTPTC